MLTAHLEWNIRIVMGQIRRSGNDERSYGVAEAGRSIPVLSSLSVSG